MSRKPQATVEHTENHEHTKRSHALKIRIDDLRTFEPLTENQRLFFEAYKGGAYFSGLFGSPGTGKCQGEDVEVNLIVSDELYDILKNS